jgi:hypothetical protein
VAGRAPETAQEKKRHICGTCLLWRAGLLLAVIGFAVTWWWA